MSVGAAEAVTGRLAEILADHPLIGRHWCGCVQGPEPIGVSLSEVELTDWSTKTEDGRECRTRILARFDRIDTEAMAALCDAIEQAGILPCGSMDLDLTPSGWWLVSAVFLRSRQSRLAQGGRRAVIEHRFRLLAG